MEKSLSNRIIKGTIIILVVGIAAKLAAFAQTSILAYFVGTSMHADAFHMISNIQGSIYPMMSTGVWTVFLPLYKKHLASGENEIASSLANKSISFFTLISIIIVILLISFAGPIVSVIAPGFEGVLKDTTVRLVRLSAPMYTFILAASVIAAMLQSHEKFFASQVREVISHIPPIIVAVLLYNKLGPDLGVNALAISLVVAAFCRILVELPFINWGYKYKPDLNLKSSEFKLMLSRMPSALISAGVGQLNTIIDASMASTLRITGTISGLNYSRRLINVLDGLLSKPVATALYPQMIGLISNNKEKELARLTVRIISIFCVLMIPASMAGFLFRKELIAAVYQHGTFTAESTALTKNVFGFYCIGITFSACSSVISNIFYGNGDTKTPMVLSIIGLASNVILNLIFIRFWKASGLALSTSVSAMIMLVLRLIFVRKYVKLDNKKILITALKILFASLIACIIPRILFGDASNVGTIYQDGIYHLFNTNRYIMLAASAVVAIPVYLLLIKLLKVTELNDLIDLLFKKFLKKRGAKQK